MTVWRYPVGLRADLRIPSHSCQVVDLASRYHVEREDSDQLTLAPGWAKRWSTVWRSAGADVFPAGSET